MKPNKVKKPISGGILLISIIIAVFFTPISLFGYSSPNPELFLQLPPDIDGDGINDNFEDFKGMDKNNPNDINDDFDGMA